MLKKLIEKVIYFIYKPLLHELSTINKNLNFLINQTVEMDKVKTMPSVKYIQIKEFEIMEKLVPFLSEKKLDYFLYGGCLIGALRHEGFVPWDDDIDIAILREDFEKLLSYEDELRQAGLFLSSPFSETGCYTGIGYDKIYEENGKYHVSICVFDLINSNNINMIIERRNKFNQMAINARNKYRGNFKKLKNSLGKINKNYFSDVKPVMKKNVNQDTFIVKSVCAATRHAYMSYHSVFPLKEIDFNVHDQQKVKSLNIPNNPKEYLTNFFGMDYMHFPKDLFPKH